MDPNLFHLDWEKLLEVLAVIIALSFFVERALSLLFENKFYIDRVKKYPIKEPIALALAYAICNHWNFDAVSIVMTSESTTTLGVIVTAAIIAGGSKASIKLFHDVIGAKSSAERDLQNAKEI